jgi:hypothetical protein
MGRKVFFGDVFIESDTTGDRSASGEWDCLTFEHLLDGSILTIPTMQGEEYDIHSIVNDPILRKNVHELEMETG